MKMVKWKYTYSLKRPFKSFNNRDVIVHSYSQGIYETLENREDVYFTICLLKEYKSSLAL